MSYNEDLAAALRYEKLRIAALIVAFSCTFAAMLLEGFEWLAWPRAIAWGVAGIFSLCESRAMKRLGRDNDYAILRAILFFIVAATYVVLALKRE
jgi:hypothetical protein